MGNICSSNLDRVDVPSSHYAPESPLPERQGRARHTPGQSPLQAYLRQAAYEPSGSRTPPPEYMQRSLAPRTPNRVELQMLKDIRHTMLPAVDGLLRRSLNIPGLQREYDSAGRLRQQMNARLGGTMTRRSGDEMREKLQDLQTKIDAFHSENPEAAATAWQRLPQGSAAMLKRDVLDIASNMVMGYETVVHLQSLPNEIEQVRVGQLLTDLARDQRVRPEVIQAASDANGDPQRLVDNLMQLVRRDPPVLSVSAPR